MSNPLAEYLSTLDARDAREQTHAQYINAYTQLADKTAILAQQGTTNTASEAPVPSPSGSARTIRPATPRGKASPAPSDTSVAQVRAELASAQKTRGDLETQVATLTTEVAELKVNDREQQKRIGQLERVKEQLERRAKDRTEELKGKGRFVEEVQDEMVAIELQLNMAEKEKERLKKENEELTRRWMEKMEAEAKHMNDNMDKEIAQRDRRRK